MSVSVTLSGQEMTAPPASVPCSAVVTGSMVEVSVTVTRAGRVRSVMFMRTSVRILTVEDTETVLLEYVSVRLAGLVKIVIKVSMNNLTITITTFPTEPGNASSGSFNKSFVDVMQERANNNIM